MERLRENFYALPLNGVNAFLWTGPGGPTLIDTGYPWTADKLLAQIQEAGVQASELQRIIITHADLDHAGGLDAVRAHTQAQVCCHTAEADYVLGRRHKGRKGLAGVLSTPIFLLLNRKYKPHLQRIDQLLLDGETLPDGFTVLHTPGHSPGHICLHHKEAGIMIFGDALANRDGELTLPPKIFTPNMPQANESLQAVLRKHYDLACFGHGPALQPQADAAITAFVKALSAA